MCTATTLRVHMPTLRDAHTWGCMRYMSSRKAGAVAVVVLLGLIIGTLGIVASSLYTVGVLILFIGGVGIAVVTGEYLIRYLKSQRPPA
jgi:hypothetical protein